MTAVAGPDPPVPLDVPGLDALWGDLLRFALRRGVPWAAAEDLVGETILKALERFDGARGAFAPFCRTILANLAKNWHRDRKPHDPLDDQPLPAPDDPAADAAEREVLALMKKLTAEIMAELEPDEAAFLLALGQALEEAESRAVAHAAHALGLSALKGWDLLRRIQRRAARHEAQFQALTELRAPAPMILRAPVDEARAIPDALTAAAVTGEDRELPLGADKAAGKIMGAGAPPPKPSRAPARPAGAPWAGWLRAARKSAARQALHEVARDAARMAGGGLARFAAGLPADARDRLATLLE